MINKNKTVEVSTLRRNDRINKHSENPSQSMNRIYSLLNRQQYTIENLLNKYKDNDINLTPQNMLERHSHFLNDGTHQNQLKSNSHTAQQGSLSNSQLKLKLILSKDQRAASKPITRQSSIDSSIKLDRQYETYRQKNRNSRQNESISLPIINQKMAKNKKKNVKDKNQFLYNFQKERQKMQHQLYKIYGQKNSYFINQSRWQVKSSIEDSISKTKKLKKEKKSPHKKQRIRNEIQIKQSESSQKTNQKALKGIQVESDDESEEQVSVVYYERQFRDLMRGQCSQQLNFLFFSKNEKMKDWTDNLLSMIQKHDKQITGIRKKSKYLQKFDDNFFSIGIFNNNDL